MPARPGGLGPTKQRKKAKKKKNRGKSPKVSSVAQDVRNALRQEAAVADIDPEDVDANFDAGFREGPVPRYSHYDESTFAPSGRLHMRAGIDLGDDEKYAGKPASRKDMYSEEENEPEDEESREVLARMRESMQRRAGEAVEFASESDEEVDSEEENEVARELKRIEKEDREALMRLTSSRDEDYKRAIVIKEQVSLWDDFLRMRISMQSLVGNANRFPQPGIYSSFKKDKRRAQPGLKDSVKASIALAEDMLGIQTALIGRNSYIEGNAGAPPEKEGEGVGDKLDRLWKRVQEGTRLSEPFCREAIGKTDERVRLQSVTNKKGLSAVNRSLLTQIDAILDNKQKLVRRTRLRQQTDVILGKPGRDAAGERGESQQEDEEIFDDTDFFQNQLKEFVSSSAIDDFERRHFEQKMNTKRSKKSKRKVDTKASKGRRLKFVKHDKIVNFMAPVPVIPLEIDMDALLSSLFDNAP